MPDPIFDAAYALAERLGAVTTAPSWLNDRRFCANLVEAVEMQAIRNLKAPDDYFPDDAMLRRLDEELTQWAGKPESAPGIASAIDRKNILLRLWFGCLATGKDLALMTNDGPNTRDKRAKQFEGLRRGHAWCPIFKAGSLSALTWKVDIRREPVDLEGIPDDINALFGDHP